MRRNAAVKVLDERQGHGLELICTNVAIVNQFVCFELIALYLEINRITNNKKVALFRVRLLSALNCSNCS